MGQGHRYVNAEYRSRTSLHNECNFSTFEKGTWGLKGHRNRNYGAEYKVRI